MQDEALILLVEDDENDALVAERALRTAGVRSSIRHLADGEQAIQYLAGEPPYQDRTHNPLPGLVLLDLKMPKYAASMF